MSKYYKYILLVFTIVCLTLIVYAVVPKNPIVNYDKEIVLETGNKELADYNFTYFEQNYISNNKLGSDISKGRRIDDYAENYLEFSDGRYHKRVMNNEVKSESYYFKNANAILYKAQIPLKLYMNNPYYLNLSNYNVDTFNVSYQYHKHEYSITNIKLSDENRLYQLDNNYKTRVSPNNPTVTVSVFIKVDNPQNKEGFIFELYEKDLSGYREKTIGLSTIKEHTYFKKVYVLGNYLEIGE